MVKNIESKILENFNGENYEKIKKLYEGNKVIGFLKMPLFVVYENTLDFPGKYVVRLWKIDRTLKVTLPTEYCIVKNTLEEARRGLPDDVLRIERDFEDDPVIVEMWI